MAGAKSGRVSDELLTYISEPLFLIPVNSFMDEHCLIFDVDSQTVDEHKAIHSSYKSLIDALLIAFGEEYHVSNEEILQGIKELDKICDIHIMFEDSIRHIFAAENFNLFCTVMAKRNIMIQEQVLAMILSVKGVLPESLKRGHSDIKGNELGTSTSGKKTVEESVVEGIPRNFQAVGDVKLSVVPNIDVKELEENQKILNEKMKKLVLREKLLHSDVPIKDGSTIIVEDIKPSRCADESAIPSPDVKQRQEFLRQQRDKLLKIRKEAMEKNLKSKNDFEEKDVSMKPVVVKSDPISSQVDKQLALRRTIAEKLRREVIEKK